jgi:hypothetical protein
LLFDVASPTFVSSLPFQVGVTISEVAIFLEHGMLTVKEQVFGGVSLKPILFLFKVFVLSPVS